QINPANMSEDSVGNLHADHFATKMRAGIDERAGDLAVSQDALLAIYVLEEKIQRQDSLRQATIDQMPFRIRKNPGDQIEGKEALGGAAVAINRERDSLEQDGKIGHLTAFLELLGSHGGKSLKNSGIRTPSLTGRGEHFVIKKRQVVAGEETSSNGADRRGVHGGELL